MSVTVIVPDPDESYRVRSNRWPASPPFPPARLIQAVDDIYDSIEDKD